MARTTKSPSSTSRSVARRRHRGRRSTSSVAIDKPFCELLPLQALHRRPGDARKRSSSSRPCSSSRRCPATTRRCCATPCARCCRITRSTSPTGSTRAWCRSHEGAFHLDDYVAYVQEFIRHLGPRRLHVISVCQPTVPVLAAVSLMATRGEPTPLHDDHDGRPDRRAQVARPRSTTWRLNKSYRVVREQRDLPRAAELSRATAARSIPGFLQHAGFVAMNPDRHLTSALRLLPATCSRGDDDERRGAPQASTTSTTPCSTCRPSTTSTPSASCSRTSRCVNGTWDVQSGEPRARPQDIKTHRAVDHRRRARRHLRARPDRGRARAVHRHPEGAPARTIDVEGRRPLRHLLRPALARDGLSGGARLHRAFNSASNARQAHRCARQPVARGPQARCSGARRSARRARATPAPAADNRRWPQPHRRSEHPARRALHDALPQTQCTRCGYPDCRGLRRRHGERRGRDQPVPARRR